MFTSALAACAAARSPALCNLIFKITRNEPVCKRRALFGSLRFEDSCLQNDRVCAQTRASLRSTLSEREVFLPRYMPPAKMYLNYFSPCEAKNSARQRLPKRFAYSQSFPALGRQFDNGKSAHQRVDISDTEMVHGHVHRVADHARTGAHERVNAARRDEHS